MYNTITYSEKSRLNSIITELETMDKNKGGRPTVENKKKTMSLRVTDEIKTWIDSQDESAGVYIEYLIMCDMEKNKKVNEMKSSEIIKECRELAKNQSLTFRRSKTINEINNRACYEIESGIEYKILHQGNLETIWETLLSECLKDL
jgi:hypothetical protein